MLRFRYVRPANLEEALSMMQEPQFTNTPLAGGTDLLIAIHNSEHPFQRFVDVSRLQELKIIQQERNSITLGAGVTFREILESKLIRQKAPFLVVASGSIGSPQIRNVGTVGGNVANAAACADSVPVLVCLEAEVHLKSLNSTRHMLVTEFVMGKKQTQIQPGEILTHFTFEVPPIGTRTFFIKLGRRNAQAISRLTVAVMGHVDAGEKVDLMRIVPGAAVRRTMRFSHAEKLLLGESPTPELIRSSGRRVAEQMVAENGQRWSTEYKEPVIAKLTERALEQVLISCRNLN